MNSPGNHLFPLWTADGKHIVYASDRSGTMDAWELEMANGQPRGEPRLLRRDLGRFLPMNITAAEASTTAYERVRRTCSSRPWRPCAQRQTRHAAVSREKYGPRVVADGASLAYLSRRGSENFGQESRSIVVSRASIRKKNASCR